ncbi:MAG: hypothetical protein U9R39_08410 [Campylobacterota bacterium]|nr:hypothetical protein [Campylobacterota bacterium]
MSYLKSELSKFYKKQHAQANLDFLGVLLLAAPSSSVYGDYEKDIAKLKGEVIAIKTIQIKNKCIIKN